MTRTVLVSGGGTGIGRAVAQTFCDDGDRCAITGRRQQPLEQTAGILGRLVTPIRCDHTNPDDLHRLLTELPRTVDVVVNCAGGNTDFDSPPAQGLAELARQWRDNLEANLLSAVLTSQALDPRLAEDARLIHIGSIAADKGAGAYGAAKAGLASWNIGLAAHLGPRGITSNVVSPGYVADTEFFRDQLTEQRRATLIASAMTGRPSQPADIAAAVHFLASPGARQITGQVIEVNGGEHPSR